AVALLLLCWEAMPARAGCCCCASAGRGDTSRKQIGKSSEVAGECGDRTHPNLPSNVTVILKVTEATRAHPPPRFSLNFDRNFSPVDDLADDCRSGSARQKISRLLALYADGQTTRSLRVGKNCAILVARVVPANQLTQVIRVSLCAVRHEAGPNRLAHVRQDRNRAKIQSQ